MNNINKIPPWNNQKWRKNNKNNKTKNNIFLKNDDSDFEKILDLLNSMNNKNTIEFSILKPNTNPIAQMFSKNKQANVIDFATFMPFQMPFKNLINKNTNKSIPKKDTSNNFILDINKKYDELDFEVDNIDDIIKLGKLFKPNHNYAFDLEKIHNIIPVLTKLKNIIGMKQVKKTIVNQILYFISGINDENNMLHTVISGPPGVGKTMLGHIIGDIYYKLGIINGNDKNTYTFKKVRRNDLIGEYMGHTAVKTQNVINECIGGVLFIDEAYSLGSNNDKRDIYSK